MPHAPGGAGGVRGWPGADQGHLGMALLWNAAAPST